MPQTNTARGTFEVQLTPLPTPEGIDDGIGSLQIAKQFHQGLEGTSSGWMIAARGAREGSAGYVALERFTGTIEGRTGSCMLIHRGLMDRGSPSLVIDVVPDTGTDQLEGLRGTMSIEIVDGVHRYALEYAFAGEA